MDIRNHVHDYSDKEAFDRKGLIYGMGHAIYSLSDPRERVFKQYVEKLAAEKNRQTDMQLYQNIEEIAPQLIVQKRQIFKGVSPNILRKRKRHREVYLLSAFFVILLCFVSHYYARIGFNASANLSLFACASSKSFPSVVK